MSNKDRGTQLVSIRAELNPYKGKQYWRSLEELANTEAFQELLHREFPSQASQWNDPVGRRKFLKLMGASLALAGLTACTRQPTETIAPYVKQPEEIIPGKPLFYATAMTVAGIATGLLVESHEGRPTKIEGNPDHPASLGATDLFAQGSVLGLYDPDRSQTLTYLGDIRPWSAFLGAASPVLGAQRSLKGAGLRILTGSVTSPTLADQINSLLTEMPSAKWHQYEPAGRNNALEGARLAFGQYVNTVYSFDKARVILSLDSDFLSCGPASVRYARDFTSMRQLRGEGSEINRLYVIESALTSTGAKADHRLPLRPSQVEAFARAVAAGLGVQLEQTTAGSAQAEHANWVAAVVNDLKKHAGSSIVIAGEYQPPVVHVLAHAMNQALGNIGKTLFYTDPVEANPVNEIASLGELVQDMQAGQVDALVILGGNPVYNAPADLNFKDALSKVRLRIHLSLYKDETSELCHWHIPEAHYLESWSDARAYDGTISIVQPLIAPLYGGKTAHEVLAAFSDRPERTSYEIVRDYWKKQGVGAGGRGPGVEASSSNEASTATVQPQNVSNDFERLWRRALHDGLIANTAFQPKTVSVRGDWAAQASAASNDQMEIVFRPDPTLFDGRFANNGWLQELPKPITKLTWDNAVMISPNTAASLGVQSKVGGRGGEIQTDLVELEFQGRAVKAPVWVMPGHADGCATVHLGYGRTLAGRVGANVGFNAYAIRTSDAPWFGAGLRINKTGDTYLLATTQLHHTVEGRDIVRSGTLDEYRKHPSLKQEEGHQEEAFHEETNEPRETVSLYPDYNYKDVYAWGMAIDLNACVGCSACVVACQSENNIPVVGKEQVLRGREMQWLRIDSYHKGEPNDSENLETYFQPVPCMHCENAPCEVVCPVNATVHSAEGLNDMVYNRCVGTRYCSNNCPYKVRRFNFLLYQDFETASLKMMRNPDVTVRSRGVMEKCTYCVQRITQARIESEKEERPIRDGDVVTACQQVCPTNAILFGNINDPESRVAKLKADGRNYGLLADLNTRPRTTYLGAVRNPNPELEKA